MEISIYDVDEYLDMKVRETAEKAKTIMQFYIVQGGHVRTWRLVGSIEVKKEGFASYFVGSEMPAEKDASHSRAYYIQKGRGEVRPKRAKYLHYFTKGGTEVFSKYSRPTAPDDFVAKTAARFK